MQGQAESIKQRFNVRAIVQIIDANDLGSNTEAYQEIGGALADYDISILVNNQTYTVPFDYASSDML